MFSKNPDSRGKCTFYVYQPHKPVRLLRGQPEIKGVLWVFPGRTSAPERWVPRHTVELMVRTFGPKLLARIAAEESQSPAPLLKSDLTGKSWINVNTQEASQGLTNV